MSGHYPDGCTARDVDEAAPGEVWGYEEEAAPESEPPYCNECGLVTDDLFTCFVPGHRIAGSCADDLYRCANCHEAHRNNLPECAF